MTALAILLFPAAMCAIGLWRWNRTPTAPRHTVTQLRRRQLDDIEEVGW